MIFFEIQVINLEIFQDFMTQIGNFKFETFKPLNHFEGCHPSRSELFFCHLTVVHSDILLASTKEEKNNKTKHRKKFLYFSLLLRVFCVAFTLFVDNFIHPLKPNKIHVKKMR